MYRILDKSAELLTFLAAFMVAQLYRKLSFLGNAYGRVEERRTWWTQLSKINNSWIDQKGVWISSELVFQDFCRFGLEFEEKSLRKLNKSMTTFHRGGRKVREGQRDGETPQSILLRFLSLKSPKNPGGAARCHSLYSGDEHRKNSRWHRLDGA